MNTPTAPAAPSPINLSPAAKRVINGAGGLAQQRRHAMTSPEHIMLALLDDDLIRTILINAAGSSAVIQLQTLLTATIDSSFSVPATSPPKWTVGSRQLIAAAEREAAPYAVHPAHMLTVFLTNPGLTAAKLMEQAIDASGMAMATVLTQRVLAAVASSAPPDQVMEAARRSGFPTQEAVLPRPQDDSPLGRAAINLSAQVTARLQRNLPSPALVGREREVARLMQIVARRQKNNAILVGEPGVGKTAILKGFAAALQGPDAPPPLRGATVWLLDLSSLVAGTRLRGDLEDRVQAVVTDATRRPGTILAIDEFHLAVGAGDTAGGMDIANLLKPHLESGALRVIGATTVKDYRERIERDGALARRFQRVDVKEPTLEHTRAILAEAKPAYERHHNILIDDAALDRTLALAGEFILDKSFPDKAFDVIDEASSWLNLNPAQGKHVTAGIVEQVVASIARLPEAQVRAADQRWNDLAQNLRASVLGQDDALVKLADAVLVGQAGLRTPDRTLASFLLAGPTGTGKTETARALAEIMGAPLLRFDMSEYQEPHSVARLIGSPFGYVDSQEGGRLTEQVHKHPHAVVLIDEIEKAHPDIMTVFLQVMDRGAMNDGRGREVSFRKTVLLFTSNSGAREAAQRSIGFTGDQREANRAAAIEAAFSPEFRNRLDDVLIYKPLSNAALRAIVDQRLAILVARTVRHAVTIDIDGDTRDRLAREGYSPAMGARPLQRLIDRVVGVPLARRLVVPHPAARVVVRWDGVATESTVTLVETPTPTVTPTTQQEVASVAARRAP